MKNIKIKITALILSAITLGACSNFMDTTPSTIYDEATVWGSRATANAFVYNVYDDVVAGYRGGDNGNYQVWETRTPNMIVKPWGAQQSSFYQDLMTNYSDYGFFGGYGTIREINMIIEKAAEYEGKGLTAADKKELVAQGKFLRAMYYFRQARGVGRFVWIDRVLTTADTANDALRNIPLTSSIAESYDLIIKDLEDAAPDMTESKTPGVFNKWAAQALLSEVCLQAAAYETDATRRTTLLNKCIAAVDILENQSGYSLVSADNFGSMFNEKNSSANSEIIYAYYRLKDNTTCSSTDMQRLVPNIDNARLAALGCVPLFNVDKVFEAWGDYYPTQNVVDAYLVIDQATGKAVKWNESSQFTGAVTADSYTGSPSWGTDAYLSQMQVGTIQHAGHATVAGTDISALMYANRDQRFYATFVYDNSSFYGEQAFTRFRGNLNRFCSSNNLDHYLSLTGYYLRKPIYNNVENGRVYVSNKTDYHWVIFRLGRALLNKAEAQLWLGQYANAVTTLNKTRTTHGGLPASTSSTSADAWKDYIAERRAELTFENDFYWSALRWGKHGGDANKGIAAGGKAAYLIEEPTFIEISRDATAYFVSTLTYNDINKREFNENRRYLLPIPQGQLDNNPNLGQQNPGWN